MKIKNIKKINKKYKIIFDNNESILTYDEIILKYNILYKKEITGELLNIINKENGYYESYNKVLSMISRKMRSRQEIINYLKKNQIQNQEKIIKELEKNNLLNDNTFLKAYITDQINLTNNGPYKIMNDLNIHGIEENKIAEELNKINKQVFINKINKIIDKKIKSNKHNSEYILKQKIISNLINLGYEKEMILEVIKTKTITSAIDKEYLKTKKKLVSKYDGEELKNKIIEKLLAKGFKLSEIKTQLGEPN